jgi:hypothetical protein
MSPAGRRLVCNRALAGLTQMGATVYDLEEAEL